MTGVFVCTVYERRKSLAVNSSPRYLLPAPAKSGAGIGLLIYFVGDILTRLRLFLCCVSGYISMVGWAGAPQGAPVANKAGKTNSVQSTTRKIGLFGGGLSTFVGGCHYGYDPYPNSPVTYRSL
ncbi:ash family protein [Pectobacterium brasiliense]|uniref:ash family protein n=1 Tax=Pectobacterium brasiliense TaxID=180957 RepID=UPI0012D2B51F